MSKKTTAYKGFDKNMQCRGFQYEIGETYTHDGKVEACVSGFHSCEYPLDVFSYYQPAESVFALVEAEGEQDRRGDDSKVASEKITIKAAIDLPGLIEAAIEYTRERINKPPASNSGDYGAASNSGDYGAASNSGDYGTASNSGDYGAASNSGYQGAASYSGDYGAASNSGDYGAASNSGDYGAASNSGAQGVAAAFGYKGISKSDEKGAIVLCHRNDGGKIIHIRASKVGENGVRPNTWYTLSAEGEFIEVGE